MTTTSAHQQSLTSPSRSELGIVAPQLPLACMAWLCHAWPGSAMSARRLRSAHARARVSRAVRVRVRAPATGPRAVVPCTTCMLAAWLLRRCTPRCVGSLEIPYYYVCRTSATSPQVHDEVAAATIRLRTLHALHVRIDDRATVAQPVFVVHQLASSPHHAKVASWRSWRSWRCYDPGDARLASMASWRAGMMHGAGGAH